jgi:hypothetical protein
MCEQQYSHPTLHFIDWILNINLASMNDNAFAT